MDPGTRTKDDLERDVLTMLATGDQPLTLEQVRERLGGTMMSTTVMTVLTRLQQRGLTRRKWTGRSFVYTVEANQAELTAQQIHGLLDAGGDRRAVLANFVAMLPPDEEQMLSDLLRHR